MKLKSPFCFKKKENEKPNHVSKKPHDYNKYLNKTEEDLDYNEKIESLAQMQACCKVV